jgi:ferredoxin
MPTKYHITTKKIPARLPKIGKFGVVDWREDCARCHNCVKKACVYDRYRQEMHYIQDLEEFNSMFFECMGCFSCVQKCTKGILALTTNPEFQSLGNGYYTPDIILTTWNQAETASIPVSGAGYRGKFTGAGFDGMWTDMSEIVRPTRDGIHGREYISTSVDLGRKPSMLSFENGQLTTQLSPLVDLPVPIIIDMLEPQYQFANLVPMMLATAVNTSTMLIIDWQAHEQLGKAEESCAANIIYYVGAETALPPQEVLQRVRLIEIADGADVEGRIAAIKAVNPELVVAVRVELTATGEQRAIELAQAPYCEVIHIVADINGNQIGVETPKFLKEMTRHIHTTLVKRGIRDQITLLASGGVALAEHMAKELLCGADVIAIEMPLLISLECRFCVTCRDGFACPAQIDGITAEYGIGRMTNLIAVWHDQLIEMMGAMGIREARRLRGETGRAIFFEDVEEETFGRLFGTRITA